MMLDIDHFKAFNDVHGHAGGDALLAQFGKLLQEHSRGEDIACRYGGEEFTLILPEAGIEAALQRAQAIRTAVESMRVQHLGRELPQVTVSIGVSAFPGDGETPESLLRVADEALYRAKHNGRNRVGMRQPAPPSRRAGPGPPLPAASFPTRSAASTSRTPRAGPAPRRRSGGPDGRCRSRCTRPGAPTSAAPARSVPGTARR